MATSELEHEDDGSISDEFIWWSVFEVAMPIFILVATWLSAQFAFEIHHPFLSTFGSGDLLPVVTLMLLGSLAETVHFIVFAKVTANRRTLSKHIAAHLVFVVMLAFAYGGIKGKGLQLLDEPVLEAASLDKLQQFAGITFCLSFFAVALAYYSKNVLLAIRIEAERGTQ